MHIMVHVSLENALYKCTAELGLLVISLSPSNPAFAANCGFSTKGHFSPSSSLQAAATGFPCPRYVPWSAGNTKVFSALRALTITRPLMTDREAAKTRPISTAPNAVHRPALHLIMNRTTTQTTIFPSIFRQPPLPNPLQAPAPAVHSGNPMSRCFRRWPPPRLTALTSLGRRTST